MTKHRTAKLYGAVADGENMRFGRWGDIPIICRESLFLFFYSAGYLCPV